MKLFIALFALVFVSNPSFALTLQDQAILGKYELNPPNKQAYIQSAEIRFDADQKLNIHISHSGRSYPLEKMEQDGLIVGGTSDCTDCGDEEEDEDIDPDRTKIRLVPGPQGRPRLMIEITWSDTLDEDGQNGETVSFVLDWVKTLPNAVSF